VCVFFTPLQLWCSCCCHQVFNFSFLNVTLSLAFFSMLDLTLDFLSNPCPLGIWPSSRVPCGAVNNFCFCQNALLETAKTVEMEHPGPLLSDFMPKLGVLGLHGQKAKWHLSWSGSLGKVQLCLLQKMDASTNLAFALFCQGPSTAETSPPWQLAAPHGQKLVGQGGNMASLLLLFLVLIS